VTAETDLAESRQSRRDTWTRRLY